MFLLRRTRCTLIALALVLAVNVVRADVVPVVAANSPVTTLSKSQVASIFLGKEVRFPNGMQVVPIDLPEGSPVRDEFYATFTGKSPAQVRAHWSKIIFTGRGKPPRAVPNSVEARKAVAGDPQAISYIERNAVDGSVRVIATP